MKLDDIIKEEIRLSGNQVEVDEQDVKRIWVNDQHLIHLRSSPDEQYFYLYAKAASLPETYDQSKVYEQLLSANLFGQKTANAVFAIHLQSKSIVLMKIFEVESTSFELYTKEFQHFINALVYWKEKLDTIRGQASSENDHLLQLMSKRHQIIMFA